MDMRCREDADQTSILKLEKIVNAGAKAGISSAAQSCRGVRLEHSASLALKR